MEKKKRKAIPQIAKVRAVLQSQIQSCCPFCNNKEVGHFEIHHIDENPSNNDLINLLLLCPVCHSKITKGDITPLEVLQKKIVTLSEPIETNKEKPSNNFYGKVQNSLVGDNNTVSIKHTTKKIKAKYPEGCIGFDNNKANYIAHLIKRYNTYKESEVGKGKMNYAVFNSQLKRRYKIGTTRTIYNVPIEKFDELSFYIQSRIDATKLAKIKGKSHKNYSTFLEYINQQ